MPIAIDKHRALAHLLDLLSIEGLSGKEGAVAAAVRAKLMAAGCKQSWMHHDRAHQRLSGFEIGNLIVQLPGRGASKNRGRLLFMGHLDTVPVHDNLPSRLDGDVIWGRGTVDMKAGDAVMLKLAAELTEPAVDITWVWYDHEEVASELNGLGRLARTRPDLLEADFAVLCEPTNAEVEGGCNGTLRVDVRVTGKRAHSARWWMGSNAIHAAAPILARLADYVPREADVDGLVYREGLNAVGIRGGIAGNVVPDECVVTVNYRFAPSRTVDEAARHVADLFAGFEVTVTDAASGARPGLDDPFAAVPGDGEFDVLPVFD